MTLIRRNQNWLLSVFNDMFWAQVHHVLGQVRRRVVDVARPAHRVRHEAAVARLVPAYADVRVVQVQDEGLAQPAQ